MEEYAGSDWLEAQGVELSDFGRRVADLVGKLWRGIYHKHPEVMHRRVRWDAKDWIEIVINGEIATFDFDEMTRLVFLCHDAAIRCSVSGAANKYLRLIFHPRKHGEAQRHLRHPTIEQALERHRAE